MSATKTNMPKGTRQAALIALCLAACLLAWRANTLLTERPAPAVAETTQLIPLLEPVLGQGTFRLGGHTDAEGTRHVLLLVDTASVKTELTEATTSRIETILSAATGFDPATDSLQMQPLAFAPGTTGGLERNDLIELGLLGGLCALLGYLAFVPGRETGMRGAATAPAHPEPRRETPHLQAVPDTPTFAPADDPGEAQRLARENPQETARIIRGWMSEGTSA